MKRIFAVVFVFTLLLSGGCSSEKINLSPISNKTSKDLLTTDDVGLKTETIAYQSEITNLISTFPKFKNDGVDQEVNNLKNFLTDYITAISKKDGKKRRKAYKNYVKSYIKIQKLRKYLAKDMDDVLNRYMVRIKTNVNLLESIN